MQETSNFNMFIGSNYVSQPQSRHSPDLNHRHDVKYHSIFTFMTTIIIDLIQIKYQGDQMSSPFETHPVTLSAALLAFFLYCFFYHNANSPFTSRIQVEGLNREMRMMCGSLALACLGSLLLPNSMQSVVVTAFCFGIGVVTVSRCAWLWWRNTSSLLPVHSRETQTQTQTRFHPSYQVQGPSGFYAVLVYSQQIHFTPQTIS